LTLWNVDDGSEITRIDSFKGALCTLAFSADGRLLATGGGRDGTKNSFGEVKIFDVESLAEVASLSGHTASVRSLAFSSDGRTLATGGMDFTVRLWDVSAASTRLSLGGFPSCVQSLALSDDGAVLAVSGRGEGTVSLFETTTGGELSRLVGHSGNVLGMTFSDGGRTLVTSSLDSTLKFWDVPSDHRTLSR
jgi:WD40 repeat protein